MHEHQPTPSPRQQPGHPAAPARSHPISRLGTSIGNRNLALYLQRQPDPQPPQTAIQRYDAEVAKATPNWSDAALYLNGCSRDDIVNRLAARTVAQVRQLHDEAVRRAGVGPDSALALLTPHLLSDFAANFRTAADNIRRSDEALRLVREAAAASVQYGGYAEDGAGHAVWAYTIGHQVFVPRARTDAVQAQNDFLFELNNAIRQPAFANLDRQATAGTITARQYARGKVEQEVEGMLRLARVWLDNKRAMGGGHNLDRYDAENYVTHLRAIEAGRKTQAQLVDEVLQWHNGVDSSATNEQFYMRQYRQLHPDAPDGGAPDAGGRH